MGLRKGVNIIRVSARGIEECPGDRIAPLISQHSDWEGTFQIIEHWNKTGKPKNYDKKIPLVIFNTEGDEVYFNIKKFEKYGTVLHCNVKLAETKGKFFNYWAYDYLTRIKDYNIQLNASNTFAPKFLSLNGRPEWHRYYLIQLYKDRNLFDKGLVSLLNRYDRFSDTQIKRTFLKSYEGDPSFILDIIDNKRTLEIDRTNEQIHENDRSHDPFIYKDTSISVVSETYGETARGCFITEKSYKPIANCHFQIWIGQPGMVKFFRKLGYDLFDDIIDHSYDNVNNDTKRYNAAIDSLEQYLEDVKHFTDDQKQDLQQRLKRNQTKYLNTRLSAREINSWLKKK